MFLFPYARFIISQIETPNLIEKWNMSIIPNYDKICQFFRQLLNWGLSGKLVGFYSVNQIQILKTCTFNDFLFYNKNRNVKKMLFAN